MGSKVFDRILEAMRPFVSNITARTLLESAMRRQRLSRDMLDKHGITPALQRAIERGLSMYLDDPHGRSQCRRALRKVVGTGIGNGSGKPPEPEHIPVENERDVVLARSKARTMAAALGFGSTEQIKIITAVSELSRNIFLYAGAGEILLRPVGDGRRGMEIVAKDKGPGIPNLEEVLSGNFRSRTGMGLGLRGCRRLMSSFEVKTSPDSGTCVTMVKLLS